MGRSLMIVLGYLASGLAVIVPQREMRASSSQHKTGIRPVHKKPEGPEMASVEHLAPSWFGRGETDVADLERYEAVAGEFDRDKVVNLFRQRPTVVAKRLIKVGTALRNVQKDWDQAGDDRGEVLCARIAALGPVATKVGQTLSQRPDLIGKEAAQSLQSLQSQNTERFSNADALHLLEKEWGKDRQKWPIRSLSIEPVAVASLGQVYKGVLNDGSQVAVKIQRPDALRSCALDFACFALTFAALGAYWRWKSGFDNGDLSKVVDTVAEGIFQELDYRLEAENALEFESSLAFLGFVSVPKPYITSTPDSIHNTTTRRVLVTEWCDGKSLDKLETTIEKRAMARRAVTACTASLVLTGLVHADPHAGNLFYIPETQKLVFIDFGLVSRVDPYVMEQFATGIRACVAGDYDTLATVFQSVGFLGTPLQYREDVGEPWQDLGSDGISRFATDLREAMARADGGTQRFGALASVLGRDLGKQYKMFTPPYCILLTRTFLTLEGICAEADPDFNIYQASMPWALQKALTPTTPDGIKALRGVLFENSAHDSNGKVKFEELVNQFFIEQESQDAEELSPSKVSTDEAPALEKQEDNNNQVVVTAAVSEAEEDEAERRQKDAVITAVVASPEGAAIRRAISDVDATDLVSKLSGVDGRPVRQAMARTLCDAMDNALNERREEKVVVAEVHPKRRRRQRKVTKTLVKMQLRRIFRQAGAIKGVLTMASLGFIFMRVSLSAFGLYLRRHLEVPLLRVGSFLGRPFRRPGNSESQRRQSQLATAGAL